MTDKAHGLPPVSVPADVGALLNAMDGVAYLTAPDGTILAVGERNWSDFASANGAPQLSTAAAVVGSNLFKQTAGVEVRQVQEHLHREVASGRRVTVTYTYRCDSPGAERLMRMSVTPVMQGGKAGAILYQSVVLKEAPRPPMSLFASRGEGPEAGRDPEIVRLCSYCHDVAWPAEPGSDVEWIEPDEYYRRGGSPDVMISHGICPDCFDRLELGRA
ncbi:hypothetical protein [Emcibacter sp. SYSU 3D8]|uniref:hypothetical protein n=1 Tax=Emcibacter sp. SYSU 3D8 TaxID=3133969 RepID=UPI0031FF1926